MHYNNISFFFIIESTKCIFQSIPIPTKNTKFKLIIERIE